MSGELEALLKLVADGRLTAAEAAPIVAALEEKGWLDARRAAAGARDGAPETVRPGAWARTGMAHEALAGRRIRVLVMEDGRSVVDLQIPLTAAGFAIDQVPGLSPEHRSRIAQAIASGMTGPILEVSDGRDQVRIVIE